jgi:hypothetical protein
MTYQEYINSLPISIIYKEILLDKKLSENNPIYYQHYPSLFSNLFSLKKNELEMLNIAGYLYYLATIFTDSLIDEHDLSKFPIISICQEESIKILTSIYSLESNFWTLWNIRKNEYFEAVIIEKKISKKEVVLIEDYEILADQKSAFGKVAIDCLFSIDKINPSIYEKLMLSHKYFSTAFQINDDIQDFKEDLKKGQFNWAVYLLEKENITNNDPLILEKYLYIRGISKKMYLLGIDYCNQSLNIIENIEIPKWKKVLNDTKKTFITAISEIDNYLEILTAEINLSKNKKNQNNIKTTINLACDFIKLKQNKNGSWHEYINQGGISDIWSTAFIVSKLSDFQPLRQRFDNEIKKALLFIEQNAISGLWSYNKTWISDSDSTNLAFLSYTFNNKKIEDSHLIMWYKFQKINGGFSTYSDEKELIEALDDNNISDTSGWLSVHQCVSAVSLYFLAIHNNENKKFLDLKEYFENILEKNIYSYWWSSEIYTLYYLAKTYHFINEIDKLNIIINKIKLNQNNNGSFSDKYGENMFYTGLALEILLLQETKSLEIDRTINFLIVNQYTDGSWDNSNALQVPNSRDIIPLDITFPIATYGMNVRAKEFNRLFSTTAILQSLSIYEQKYST